MSALRNQLKSDPLHAILEGDDISTAIEIIETGSESGPARLRLLAVRTLENRPHKWEPGGSLESLPLLDSQYPVDATHVAIWPDGIVGQDFHANAPRLGRLSYFIRTKQREHVSFELLYRPDMIERLNELRGHLRSIEIGINKPHHVSSDSGAFGTLMPTVFRSRAPSINIKMGMGRASRRNTFLDTETEDAAYEIAERAQDYVDRMVIGGYNTRTEKVESINLMHERIQEHVKLKPDHQVPTLPDLSDVFAKLDETYREFQASGVFEHALTTKAVRKG